MKSGLKKLAYSVKNTVRVCRNCKFVVRESRRDYCFKSSAGYEGKRSDMRILFFGVMPVCFSISCKSTYQVDIPGTKTLDMWTNTVP